jgi:hypothetical protein
MKNLLIFLLVLLGFGCLAQKSDIKYNVYHKSDSYWRVLTYKKVNKETAGQIIKVLKPSVSIIYFHTPAKTGRSEEYCSLIGSQFISIYTPAASEFNVKEEIKEERPGKKISVTKANKNVDKERQASIIAMSIIKRKLKAPSTAKFSSTGYVGETFTDNTYSILSYVDAQNSYGAEIRTHYKIKLKYLGGEWEDEDNWEVLSLEME